MKLFKSEHPTPRIPKFFMIGIAIFTFVLAYLLVQAPTSVQSFFYDALDYAAGNIVVSFIVGTGFILILIRLLVWAALPLVQRSYDAEEKRLSKDPNVFRRTDLLPLLSEMNQIGALRISDDKKTVQKMDPNRKLTEVETLLMNALFFGTRTSVPTKKVQEHLSGANFERLVGRYDPHVAQRRKRYNESLNARIDEMSLHTREFFRAYLPFAKKSKGSPDIYTSKNKEWEQAFYIK